MIGSDQPRRDRQNRDRQLDLGKLGRSHVPQAPPNHSFSIKAVLRPKELNPTHPSCLHLKPTSQEQQTKARDGMEKCQVEKHDMNKTGGRVGQGHMNSTGMSPGKG